MKLQDMDIQVEGQQSNHLPLPEKCDHIANVLKLASENAFSRISFV